MSLSTYHASESESQNVSNRNFRLHNHAEYEIYMFIEGNATYIVEGIAYNLNPHDVIVIRKNEMHRVFHNKSTKYRRFVLMISSDFFVQKKCLEYETGFLTQSEKYSNKINAEIVHSSGLYDAIARYKEYSQNYTVTDTPITDSSIIEILHILNSISSFSYTNVTESPVADIIAYINDNFTNDITLEELSQIFFLSKYYLCHLFKKHTGLTIQSYIRRKRLSYVRDLHAAGKSFSNSAMLAGFHNYSSFYRAHVKEFDAPPKA